MKTITTFASMLISGLFIFQSVNSQEINNRTFAMNLTVSKTDNFTSDNETESAPVLK